MPSIISSSYSASFEMTATNLISGGLYSSSVYYYNENINLDQVFYYKKITGTPFIPRSAVSKPGITFIKDHLNKVDWYYNTTSSRDIDYNKL